VEVVAYLHDDAARVLFLGLEESATSACLWMGMSHLRVEQFALGAQAIALGDQIVNLLAALHDALDSLLHDDFCLIQLLLDLHKAVRLFWVLVLLDVILQFWHLHLRAALGEVGVSGGWVFDGEFFRDLSAERLCDKLGILDIGNDDGTDFVLEQGIDHIACDVGSVGALESRSLGAPTLLFDAQHGAWFCACGNCTSTERHLHRPVSLASGVSGCW
jgi:hypothetical protein